MNPNSLEDLLDLTTELRTKERYEAIDAIGRSGGLPTDPAVEAVVRLLGDRNIRPEHRARILRDLAKNRDLLLETHDPGLVELIFWGEHVESLYKSHVKRNVSTFHYARALEATCRRCGFELLGVMGRMKELGKQWSHGDYAKVRLMLRGEDGGTEVDEMGDARPAQPTS